MQILAILAVLSTGSLGAQQQNEVHLGYFVNGQIGPHRIQTALVIRNQARTDAILHLQLRRTNGEPMQDLELQSRARRGRHQRTGPGGEIQGLRVPPGSFRSYESTGIGPLELGSCWLESTTPILAYSRVRLFDQDGRLISEVHIRPSGAFRSAGFFLGRMDPEEVGVAFTNASPESSAVCRLQLYETAEGAEPDPALLEGEGVLLTLDRNAQTSRMLMELFEEQYDQSLKEFLADPENGDVYAVVTCDNPICAVVLHLNGLEYLGIPVNPEQ